MRIIDNKRVDMTDEEWDMYQKIVKSYTDLTGKGEDLFIDLFETNGDGIITFLKPPSKRRTSLEVFLFLMALMQHQHLRLMHQQIEEAVREIKENNKTVK
jgi:hypothetical protein